MIICNCTISELQCFVMPILPILRAVKLHMCIISLFKTLNFHRSGHIYINNLCILLPEVLLEEGFGELSVHLAWPSSTPPAFTYIQKGKLSKNRPFYQMHSYALYRCIYMHMYMYVPRVRV